MNADGTAAVLVVATEAAGQALPLAERLRRLFPGPARPWQPSPPTARWSLQTARRSNALAVSSRSLHSGSKRRRVVPASSPATAASAAADMNEKHIEATLEPFREVATSGSWGRAAPVSARRRPRRWPRQTRTFQHQGRAQRRLSDRARISAGPSRDSLNNPKTGGHPRIKSEDRLFEIMI